MSFTLAEARAADAADPLRPVRERFHLPEGLVYLDGNSLGPLPKAAVARLAEIVTEEWGEQLIRSWNSRDWIGAPQRIGGKLAPLLGARPDELIVTDSTSVNLMMEANAAFAGAGVAMMTPMFWRGELASGRLVQPFARIHVTDRSHWLVYPEGRRNQPKIAAFRDWLLAQAEAEKALEPAEIFIPPPAP